MAVSFLRKLGFRLLQGVVVVIGVTLIAFLATFLTGDPAALMLGEGATTEEIAAFRSEMGFDRPLLVQYGEFLSNALQGNFGNSLYYKRPNVDMVMERLPNTLKLAAAALLLSLVAAIPLGVLAAKYHNTWGDTLIMLFGLIGQATPSFWLGLMMMMFLAVQLHVLPVSGMGSWKHYIMPVISLATFPLAQNLRMMRSSMLEVLGDDYIKTARSKGLTDIVVYCKHALKNSLKPVVTQVGLQMGSFLGGAVVIETIFAWPGIGRLAVQAIQFKDFPLLQTVVAFLGIGFVAVNFIVDLVYAVIDPRVRL